MEELYQFSLPQLMAITLIFIRMSAFVVTWPVFGVPTVPTTVKVLFALILTLILYPLISWQSVVPDLGGLSMIWLAAREAFIGACLGFVGRFFFFAISGGGQLISLSIGLSSAQVYNPSTENSENILEQFQVTLATFIFLLLNGHHFLLTSLVKSYELVPLSKIGVNLKVFGELALMGGTIIEISVKVAAPILVAMILMNVAMGVVGRAVPQINVLVTSLSVNILFGFFILIVGLPVFIDQSTVWLNDMFVGVFQLIKAL